jgi:hypothetical protein
MGIESPTYDTSGGPAGLLFSIRLELLELELSRKFRLDRIAEAFAARYLEKCATGARAGAGAVFLDSMARLRYRSSIAKSPHLAGTQTETRTGMIQKQNRGTIQGAPSCYLYLYAE